MTRAEIDVYKNANIYNRITITNKKDVNNNDPSISDFLRKETIAGTIDVVHGPSTGDPVIITFRKLDRQEEVQPGEIKIFELGNQEAIRVAHDPKKIKL